MNKVFKKDVTDEEISIAMKPFYREIQQFLVPRVKRAENTRKNPPRSKQHKKSAKKKQMTITQEEKEYTESIFDYPNLNLTARGELLGFSSDKRTRIKNNLIKNQMIIEFSVDLGRETGGRVKLLKLTDDGYRVLGEKPPQKIKGISKRGSLEHIWWQECIAQDYNKKGYKAIIEKELNGKCADIGVIKGGEIVAVEVELSPKNAVTNFKQNMEVGFSRTIIACKNYLVKKETEKKILRFIEKHPHYTGKAKIILLKDFPFVKNLRKEIRGL